MVPHQAVGAVASGTAAALGETVQAAHQQAQGEQREQQIHHAAADQPRAHQQALGIAAVPVGIADALCQAPGHMGQQADHHQPEQHGTEGLPEQLLHGPAGVHGVSRAQCGHDGEESDDHIHQATRCIAAARQPDHSAGHVHRFPP